MYTFLEDSHDVIAQVGTTSGDHDLDIHVFSKLNTNLTSLKSQLSRWHNHKGWKHVIQINKNPK